MSKHEDCRDHGSGEWHRQKLAHRLASDCHRVAICDRDEALLATVAEEFSRKVLAHPCDVSDPDQVNAFLDQVRRWAGAPTILVNNAGFARDLPFDEFGLSAMGHAGRASYCAAKPRLEGMTRSLATELGSFGITVNAIAPGLIVTKMTESTAARRGLSLEQHLENAVARIPVRRAGTPDDVAAAASYFIHEEASFVTGQVLTVSGGVVVYD